VLDRSDLQNRTNAAINSSRLTISHASATMEPLNQTVVTNLERQVQLQTLLIAGEARGISSQDRALLAVAACTRWFVVGRFMGKCRFASRSLEIQAFFIRR